MRILVFGGTGFVGLNIAAALLARGHALTLFDRAGLPPDAKKDFTAHRDRLTAIQGDVTDSQTVEEVIAAGYEAIILAAAITAGPEREAVLSRPGVRDWIYAVDVAEAVTLLIEAARPKHQLYNISTGAEWSALQWGRELAALHPGFICRLTDAGEAATVDLHSPADRAPLAVLRMAEEFGWRARFGCADSAADLSVWWTAHRRET